MNIEPIQVSSYVAISPILQSMKVNNDKLPKNSLPINTSGTIQENAEENANPTVTLYNARGLIQSNTLGALIGVA